MKPKIKNSSATNVACNTVATRMSHIWYHADRHEQYILLLIGVEEGDILVASFFLLRT